MWKDNLRNNLFLCMKFMPVVQNWCWPNGERNSCLINACSLTLTAKMCSFIIKISTELLLLAQCESLCIFHFFFQALYDSFSSDLVIWPAKQSDLTAPMNLTQTSSPASPSRKTFDKHPRKNTFIPALHYTTTKRWLLPSGRRLEWLREDLCQCSSQILTADRGLTSVLFCIRCIYM